MAYAITDTTLLVRDGMSLNWLLRDSEDSQPDAASSMHTQAMVASGDFCETLAARLDQVACALPATSVEQYQLQNTIRELLFVQQHYKIVKK